MELPVLPRPATALPPRPVVGAPSSQPATETGLVEVTSPIQVLGVQAASPLAWNSEGDVLAAASSNHSIFLFQLSGQAFKMSKLLASGHRLAVKTLLFHPQNSDVLVSGGVEGIFVWSVSLGRVTLALSHFAVGDLGPSLSGVVSAAGAHESDVECLCWTHDGATLVSGSKDNNVKAWAFTAAGPAAKAPAAPPQLSLLETITGHKGPILGLAYCPSTERLASAGRDASIKLWDASTLAPAWRAKRSDDGGIVCSLQGTCEGHRGDVIALTWADGGRTLISGARDNTLRLWNAATCTTVREIFDRKQGVNGKHRADVRRAVVLPDAPQGSGQPPRRSLLTASMDGTLRVWQLAPDDAGGASSKGTAGSRPGEPTASGRGAASDAEADLLLLSEADAAAAAGGGGAGSAAGATRRQPPSAAVSLDALDVGAGWDDTTKSLLIEILAGKGAVDVAVDEAGHDLCLASLSFFERDVGVSSLALNPNPARPIVAVSSSAHTLALLALRTDTLPWLTRQAEGTLPAGVLPPGTDLAPLSLVQTFAGHEGAVTGVALLPDEATLVSVGADSRVSVYDVATVDRRLSLSFGTSALCVSLAPSTVASASSSAFVFVGGADYVIRAYSADPADYAALTAAYAALPVPQPVARHDYEAARYVGHAGRVETIAIHPNGRIMASGGRDWSVLLWSLVKPALTLSPSPREESDVPVCSPLARVDAHRGFVSCLRFSPLSVGGGLLASAGNDHAVRVWRVSPGGLLSGASMERVWESSSAPEAGGHAGAVSALAWVGAADDGTPAQLFSGSWDGTVKCWQAETPQLHGRAGGEAGAAPLATLAGHASRVTAVEADPDGHVVVSTSADFTARIWRRYSPFVCLSVYRGTASDGVLTSLSVGRSVFVTGSESGGILVWPLRPPGVGVAGSAAALRDSGSSLDGPERVVVGGMGLPDAPTTRAAAEVLGRGPPARLTAVGPAGGTAYPDRRAATAGPTGAGVGLPLRSGVGAALGSDATGAAEGGASGGDGSDHSAASKAPLLSVY